MGVLETDTYPIIFSTDNTNSAIGFYNAGQDTYVPILDDASMSFRLGFSTEHYITGQTQRNYKGELVGAFTDKVLPPFYLNFDNPNVSSLDDMLLFVRADAPTLSLSLDTGGVLLPGAYYVAAKLVKLDGTETGYLTVSAPKIISGTQGTPTDQSLRISVRGMDDSFDQVRLAIVSRIAGVTKAVELAEPIAVSGNGVILYTGTELTTDSSLEEILTPMAYYDQVSSIAQLNDALYLLGLHSAPQLKMQKYASLVRLKWYSKLTTVDPPDEKMKSGETKGFMHQEVYDFYIRYKMGGRTSPAFPIPGPALLAGELAPSSVASAEGITARKFQVEDTIGLYHFGTKSGYMGKWQNETEVYPDTPDFDATDVGGENLRGQPVRHHRFPSIAWCKDHLYPGDPTYGRSRLDMLGISVENVIIPSEYASQITGWEILYAKRTIGSSTQLGQSLLLFGARSTYEPQYSPATLYSTGGNWNSELALKKSDPKPLKVDQSIFHFHAFDILFSNPSLTPTYLFLQLKTSRQNIGYDNTAFIENSEINLDGAATGPIVYCLDYLEKGTPPTSAGKLKAVKDTEYVPNNALLGAWQNKMGERFFGGRISHPENLLSAAEISTLKVEYHTDNGGDATKPNQSAQFEYTYLTNLCALRKDLYVPFTGQNLVRAASANLGDNSVFYAGDTYISDYSFHTYGWWKSNQDLDPHVSGPFKGTKVVRRFICETAANLYSRYEDPANQYSKYYPKSPLVYDDADSYLVQFMRDQDPNQFGYSGDSNAQDDLISSSIFNTFAEDITDHPYRIHRGGKLSRQSTPRSWRTFLPLDYYEMQKNMGPLVHGEGMDDRLLIHCENALFLTQDKTKLESDLISVTLGTGDIFQFEPQESLSAPRGYAGTQHDLACVRTPFGYIFIDSKQGQVFIYKGQLQLINSGLDEFFRQYLRLKEKNPFIGNGYTIGYDPTYKRILLTAKNRHLLSEGAVSTFDASLLPTMTPGDIVYKNGRLQKFLGVNATEYDCEEDTIPTATGFSATIGENTTPGTLVGTVTGTGVDDYYFTGNSTPFSLDPSTGEVTLSGPLDYYEKNSYAFQGRAVNSNGNYATFSVQIDITAVDRPPVPVGGEVTILDNTPSATAVFTVHATDRENDPINFSIIGGNTDAAFQIDAASGTITVADGSLLDGLSIPQYILTVTASDGTQSATCQVTIKVTHVNEAPEVDDVTITIEDTTPSGAVIYTLELDIDPEGDDITYTLVHESIPGVFSFNPETGEISLVDNNQLNPAVTSQYTLDMSVTDGLHDATTFTVTINVIYDRAELAFAPDQSSCSSTPTCQAGWTLSADGTTCTRETTTPPDTTQQNSCLAESTNGVYNSFGTRIYNEGFSNDSISEEYPDAGEIYAVMTTTYWMSMANRIGVWVDTICSGSKDALAPGAQTTILYKYTNSGAGRRVYVGVFGDNQFVFKVNDQTIAATQATTDFNFKYLHVFPVDIINGTNIFNVVGTGDGSVNDAIGFIIFDNTAAEVQAATGDSSLHIIFDSSELRGTNTTIATCPDGYVLDDNDGSPICRKIESEPSTPAPSTKANWAKVKVTDTRRSSTIATVDNQQSPAQMFQDVSIPYYPPVEDSDLCSGSKHLYLSTMKQGTAQKNDCTTGTGETVTYAVPAGLYTSTTSQDAADTLAQNDVDTNKQDYANQKGGCS